MNTKETTSIDNSDSQSDSVKHGQGLRALVYARKSDLEIALAHVPADNSTPVHIDQIEEALNAVDGLLTGDLDNISEATAAQLNQWLETSKYLTASPKPEHSAKH